VSITEIQEAILSLNSEERAELRQWFSQFEEDDWDRQITADAASGKLDFLTEEALRAKREGKLKPLPDELTGNS
jgi:hypothetical protein